MNERPFIRKIMYLAGIVILLIPLSLLSMPARKGAAGQPGSAGGMLARLRDQNKLSQANLGQIDPTSETIKLATLGMRGIAANILWSKANDYRKKEDWTAFSATLEQIKNLQPNFPNVWQFQGWNVAYNISAEFDDYRDRYFYVIKGIRFLQDGITYNENSSRLVWYLGWVVSHKIGRADERLQFRRLFREDNDFHGSRPVDERDNWLVGREYFLDAEDVAERVGVTAMMNPLVFLSHAPLCRINYATAMEEEGVFEEKAGVAWDLAYRDWLKYGQTDIRTVEDRSIRLGEIEQVRARFEELKTQLAELPPAGRREKLVEEKRAKLLPAEREAVDKPADKRSENEARLAYAAEAKLAVSYDDLAAGVDAAHRDEARQLAKQLADVELTLNHINRGREVVNYPYWLTRCEMERRADALEARRLVSQGDKAFQVDQDLLAAQQHYEQGFAKWDEVLDRFPSIRAEGVFGEDMMDVVKRYQTLLKRLDKPFPDDFPLRDIIDTHSK